MALSKSEREKCWNARDLLWNCMDEKQAKHQEMCKEFRAQYEKSCPSQWVKHFDRKREYLKFKEAINNEGREPSNEMCYLGIPSNGNSAGLKDFDAEMRYGNSLTVRSPTQTQTSRSTSSVPGDLGGNCSPTRTPSPDDGNRSTFRVIRKFPSLSSI